MRQSWRYDERMLAEPPEERCDLPAKQGLAHLLRVRGFADFLGNINLEAFYKRVAEDGGWSTNHVRKMVEGSRTLQPQVLEVMARLLDIDPAYFREYRLWQIEQAMERNPEVVDALYDIAMGFEEARGELKGGGRRKKAGGG